MAYIKYKIYKNTSSAGVMNKFYACAYHDEPPMAAREALNRAAATYRWDDRAKKMCPAVTNHGFRLLYIRESVRKAFNNK